MKKEGMKKEGNEKGAAKLQIIIAMLKGKKKAKDKKDDKEDDSED